jgi:hypothetical protein
MKQTVLSENTRKVLSQLTDINKIAVIDYPLMNVKSESGTVVAFFSTKDLGEQEFEPFGVFNTQELLQVIGLSEDPEIVLENNIISITGSDSSIRYTTTDLGILGDYTKYKPVVLEKTKAVDTVTEFKLSADNFSRLKKASDVFKNLEDFIIKSDDSGKVNIEIGESNKKIKNSNSYTLSVDAEVQKEIDISIDVKNIKIIPTGNYTVQIKYNEDKDAYRVLMVSEDIDSLEFIIAIKS